MNQTASTSGCAVEICEAASLNMIYISMLNVNASTFNMLRLWIVVNMYGSTAEIFEAASLNMIQVL